MEQKQTDQELTEQERIERELLLQEEAEKKKAEKKRLMICLAGGMVITIAGAAWSGLFSAADTAHVFEYLSDGAFFAAGAIGGFGLLKWIRNDGLFDGICYFAKRLFRKPKDIPTDRSRDKATEDYASYRDRKAFERKSARVPLITGGIYLALSLVFLAGYFVSGGSV